MKTMKHIGIFSMLTIVAANLWAADYTDRVTINGTNFDFENGDSVIVNNARAIYVLNNATMSVANPDTDGIYASIGSLASPIVNDQISGNILRAISVDNSTANIGTNTSINIFADGDNISARGLLSSANADVIAGDSLSVIFHGTYSSNSSAGVVANNAKINIGKNLNIYALNARGVEAASGGSIVIGESASIEANTGVFARLSSIEIQGGTVKGVGENGLGAFLGADGIINLKNTSLTGNRNAIEFQAEAGGEGYTSGQITIDGGTVSSNTGALITTDSSQAERTNAVTSTVIIKGGANASSGAGILFQESETKNVGSSLHVSIEGNNTAVDGIFNGGSNLNTTLSVSDSATWTSTGASNMDNLILSDANIEFNMTSTTDRITTENLTLEGDNTVTVGLTNDFLQEVVDLGLPQDFDVGIVKSMMDGDGNIVYTLATSNDSGSTWDIEDLGGGWFRIDNISIVPEPSTYAAIFGVLALAFATYRRKIAPTKK